jgi:hypothetical protein
MAIRKKIWVYPDSLPTFSQTYLTSGSSNLTTFSLSSDYISASGYLTGTGNLYNYADITSIGSYTIQAGDYLEYDVYWVGSGNIQMSMDLHVSDGNNLRDSGATDQNGILCHPSTDLSSYAYGKWYHRVIPITTFTGGSSIGKSLNHYNLVAEMDTSGATSVAYFKNIAITDGQGTGEYNISSFHELL